MASNLPELQGSAKQIAWAEQIRSRHEDILSSIGRIWEEIKKLPSFQERGNITRSEFDSIKGDISFLFFKKIVAPIKNALGADFDFGAVYRAYMAHVSAHWWIDHREAMVSAMQETVESMAKTAVPQIIEEQTQEEIAARSEALIVPKGERHSEAVAEISEKGEDIFVSFPEKSEVFRLACKDLGLRWQATDRVWACTLISWGETPEDRMAEIAATLVSKGFVCSLFNEIARQKALEGTFKPRVRRIVSVQGEGLIVLTWAWKDDLYRAARQIPKSKWDSTLGAVTAPIGVIGAVKDFAEENRFSFAPSFQAAWEKHQAVLSQGAVLDKGYHIEHVKASTERPQLDPPVDPDVDPTLLDE